MKKLFKSKVVKFDSRSIPVILFVLILWIPLIQSKINFVPEAKGSEKRELEAKPSIGEFDTAGIAKYVSDYESYFNDNIGFRNYLIRINSFLKIKIFKTSPLEKVVLGKEGWLFYNDISDGCSLDDLAGDCEYSSEDLKIIEKNNLAREKYFKDRNIKFAIVIAPNKHTIYPEFLPRSVKISGKRRMEQIMSSDNNKRIILDLAPSLLEAKKIEDTYSKTDTHWNDFGAFVAYKNIESKLLNTESLYDNIELLPSPNAEAGDLAEMISGEQLFSDINIELKSLENAIRSDKKIMIFHDSFGESLKDHFDRNFESTTFIKYPYIDTALIEQSKPDIVIWEVVERYSDHMKF